MQNLGPQSIQHCSEHTVVTRIAWSIFPNWQYFRVEILVNKSVNYGVRFSGPVTSLTARRVWYGVGTRSICQADPLAGYGARAPKLMRTLPGGLSPKL